MERNISEHQLSGCRMSPNHIKFAASKEIFCKVLTTHLFKLAYL